MIVTSFDNNHFKLFHQRILSENLIFKIDSLVVLLTTSRESPAESLIKILNILSALRNITLTKLEISIICKLLLSLNLQVVP